MIQEPQQSPLFAQYMTSLRWQTATIDGVLIYFRTFGLFGGLLKIHRPYKLPGIQRLIPIIKHNHLKTLVVEPTEYQNQQELDRWCKAISRYIKINTSPYLPTKTLRIDVTRDEKEIFRSFSEAKRRAVRRAAKLSVMVHSYDSIQDLISVKNKSAGFFGFITTTGIRELWKIFSPKHASILLARDGNKSIIGGVLLLHWNNVSYYWIAGSTKYGKKLFAPTLLVWEAIRESKRYHSKLFDFVGVWDERIPKKNTDWKGFTKFKEGFGGKTIFYPLVETHQSVSG